jgi:arylformamidase
LDFDRAYANGPFIPGAETFPPRWTREAAAFRAAMGQRARTGIPYGSRPRNRLDLFLPEAAPHGLLVFVHGGYWLGFDREMWSHLASGAVARGMGLRHTFLHARARSPDRRDDPRDCESR